MRVKRLKESGILMHISSLPSKYGIGTFSKEAYEFVDFLYATGNKYWQVLPMNQTSYGDSPYQSPSAFAGNPYFIDLDQLAKERLLTKDELNEMYVSDDNKKVDYGALFYYRYIILRKAYERFTPNEVYNTFVEENSAWLDDYALFMALKVANDFKSFLEWDVKYKTKRMQSMSKFTRENEKEIGFWKFLQYKFFEQYFKLKAYANKKGVEIIGDMPIYVALDSVDVWANKKDYLLNSDMSPKVVAGCPPDYFSAEGQLWGNPLYNWRNMKNNGYKFWENRLSFATKMYDYVRIDHFRAFASYYVIDAKAENAIGGHWAKGVRMNLFDTLAKTIDVSKVIAEDLGTVTPDVYTLMRRSGYPGMKVQQFGLDSDEKNEHFYKNYKYNIISYTGTHDNATAKQFIDEMEWWQREKFDRLLGDIDESSDVYKMIGAIMKSKAKVAIVPIQDYLEQGIESRMNFPSKVGYWTYRVEKEDLSAELKLKIKTILRKYKRNVKRTRKPKEV